MALNAGIIEAILKLRDEMSPALKVAGKNLDQAGRSMQATGRALVPLSAGMALVGGAAIKMAMDFNKGMSEVSTLIPGNIKRVQELKKNVQDMAIATGKSTEDLIGGLYQVISAFGDSGESAKLLEINAKAAAAGMATTTDAINLTSAVTKVYGDTSAEANQKAADLAFMTVKLGQTTFPELAQSIGSVTPIAQSLAVSQEELFASFATLTGVTGNAAEVSTQLRGAMMGLMKPTDEMKTRMNELGFTSASTMIKQYGLVKSIQMITAEAKGNEREMGKLFVNIRGLPAVLALSGEQAGTFAGKLDAMENSAGAATEAYEEISEGVNKAGFQFQQAKQQFIVAAQTLGDALMPALTDLLNILTPVAEKIAEAAKWFQGLPEPVRGAALALGGVVAAAGPLLYIMGQMTIAVGALSTAIGTASGGLIFALGALGIAIAAVVAGGMLGNWLYETNKGFAVFIDFVSEAAQKITGWSLYKKYLEEGKDASEAWTQAERESLQAFKDSQEERVRAIESLREYNTELRKGFEGKSPLMPEKGQFDLGTLIASAGDPMGLRKITEETTAAIERETAAMQYQVSTSNEAISTKIKATEEGKKLAAASEIAGVSIKNLADAERILKIAFDNSEEGINAHNKALEDAAKAMREMDKHWRDVADDMKQWSLDKARKGAEEFGKTVLEDLKKAQAPLRELGPSTQKVQQDFAALTVSVDKFGGGIAKLHDSQLTNYIKKMEELAQQGDITDEQWERLGAAYTEAAERGLDKTVQLTTETFDFAAALDIARNAAEMLGQTGLGGLIGNLVAGAQAGMALAQNIRSAMNAKDAEGNRKGWGGLTTNEKMGAMGSLAGQASNIWNANKTNLSGGSAALSGAASGAAAGSAFGPIGAGVGAVAGALIGFFAGSKFRKIAKDAGKVLGTELSEETVSAIQETMEALDLSAAEAALLHIGEAIEDSGKSAEEFSDQMVELMKAVEDGSIPAAEGLAAIGENFNLLRQEAELTSDFASQGMLDMIEQSRQMGKEIPEIAAYIKQQLDSAAEGVAKFVNALDYVSDEKLPELGKNAGIIFGAMFDALVAENGIVAAVDQLGGSFQQLRERLLETLGQQATSAILGPFAQAFRTLQDETLRPIFEGIDGLSQAMTGLANTGYLNTQQFNAMQSASKTLFDEAVAGGADMKTALAAVAPQIQAAVDAAARFGLPLNEDMEALKALAEQNGYTFTTDPMQAMLDVLVSIAEVLGADIPAAAQKAGDAIGGMPRPQLPSGADVLGEYPRGIPRDVPQFRAGSLVEDFGKGTLVELHGREAVLTEAQYQALTSRAATQTSPADVAQAVEAAVERAISKATVAAQPVTVNNPISVQVVDQSAVKTVEGQRAFGKHVVGEVERALDQNSRGLTSRIQEIVRKEIQS